MTAHERTNHLDYEHQIGKMTKTTKWQQILSLVTCFLLVLAVSIRRDGKALGHDLRQEKKVTVAGGDTIKTLADGSVVVNTSPLGKDIIGYGGTVPLEITIKDGRVLGIKALDNAETPEFFEEASLLLTKWNGKSIEEAQRMQVDAVSGATFSSKAIVDNVHRGLQYAAKATVKPGIWDKQDLSAKSLAALAVVLLAAILPLLVKDRRYRLAQHVLNVAILGSWCGTFLNYTSMVGFMSNGINVLALLAPAIMLVTAFVYPLFGKKSYYCTNVCPYGSLQELAGKAIGFKIKMKPKTAKRLDLLRQLLWVVLMLCLWTGVWFDWIAYEPFSAFIFQQASWVAIVIAVAFVLLSMVMPRPYCRFVCPTGSLFKYSQYSSPLNKKQKQ